MFIRVPENCHPSMKEVTLHNFTVMLKCKITVYVETQYTSYIHFFNAPLADLEVTGIDLQSLSAVENTIYLVLFSVGCWYCN